MASLPDLSAAPVRQWARATGTGNATAQTAQAVANTAGRPRTGDHAQARPMDGARLDVDGRNTGEKNSASCLARKGSFSRDSSRDDAQKTDAIEQAPGNENARKSQENRGFSGDNGEVGIRTRGTAMKPYNGLANRRFQPLSHLSINIRSNCLQQYKAATISGSSNARRAT